MCADRGMKCAVEMVEEEDSQDVSILDMSKFTTVHLFVICCSFPFQLSKGL